MCTRFRRRNRLHACLPGDFNEIEEDATDSPTSLQKPSVFRVSKLVRLSLLVVIIIIVPLPILPSFFISLFHLNVFLTSDEWNNNFSKIDRCNKIYFIRYFLSKFDSFISNNPSLSKYRASNIVFIESYRNRTWTKFTTRIIVTHRSIRKRGTLIIEDWRGEIMERSRDASSRDI